MILGTAAHAGECDRQAFGSYRQTDLMDTRARLLASRAIGEIVLRPGSGGTWIAVAGSWHDPFSGRDLLDVPASTVEIDHIIPVCWAWHRGAEGWTRARRNAFYNDERFLLVVERGLNGSKGSQGPDLFVPLNPAFRCDYVQLFLSGMHEYGLAPDPGELAEILETRDLACADAAVLN